MHHHPHHSRVRNVIVLVLDSGTKGHFSEQVYQYEWTNIYAVRISSDKSIISLHSVAKIEREKRVPELGQRELIDFSPDVLTAWLPMMKIGNSRGSN